MDNWWSKKKHPKAEPLDLDQTELSGPIELRLTTDDDSGAHRLHLLDSKGRRKHVRFVGEITAVLSNDQTTFRTTTLNISSGGALFREMIPLEFNSRPFDCLFIAEKQDGTKQYLMVRGMSLDAPLRSSRVQFVHAPEYMQEALHNHFG